MTSAGFTPPPHGQLSHLLRLARFIKPYGVRIAVALLALVVAAGCVLALGQGMRHVIDSGFMKADAHRLNVALGAVIGIALVLAVATWARFYLMMTTGER